MATVWFEEMNADLTGQDDRVWGKPKQIAVSSFAGDIVPFISFCEVVSFRTFGAVVMSHVLFCGGRQRIGCGLCRAIR